MDGKQQSLHGFLFHFIPHVTGNCHLEGDAAAHIHGVDDVAETLAHLAPMCVTDDGVQKHFLHAAESGATEDGRGAGPKRITKPKNNR